MTRLLRLLHWCLRRKSLPGLPWKGDAAYRSIAWHIYTTTETSAMR